MADVIKWDESCRVGVEEFDEAHRKLFSIGNRMIRATVQNEGPSVAFEVINEMIEYAEDHFKREEDLLRQTGFPGCAEHQDEHKRLLNEIFLFKSHYIAQTVEPSEIATFLINWIVLHIKDTDKKYREHLNSHGIQ